VCSKRCAFNWISTARMPRAAMLKSTYLKRQRGNAEYSKKLKIFFRSKYEMYVMEDLFDFGIKSSFFPRYEEVGFTLSNGAVYIPDFFVIDRCLVEVKGKWGVGGKKKMHVFRAEFPDIPLLVIPWTLKEEFYEGRGDVIC